MSEKVKNSSMYGEFIKKDDDKVVLHYAVHRDELEYLTTMLIIESIKEIAKIHNGIVKWTVIKNDEPFMDIYVHTNAEKCLIIKAKIKCVMSLLAELTRFVEKKL